MTLNFRPFLAFSDFGFETLAVFEPLRYALVPSMFVLAAAVVVADRLWLRRGRGARLLGAALVVGLLGLGLVHLDAGPTNRSDEPGWSGAVDRAADRCRRTERRDRDRRDLTRRAFSSPSTAPTSPTERRR